MRDAFLCLCMLLCVVLSDARGEFSHADRPHITDVSAAPMNSPPPLWGKVKDGSVAFIAELVSLYPNAEFYFLARDSEYIYDMAEVLSKGEKDLIGKFHLLHTSRKVVTDPLIQNYLKQEGLTRSHLNGRTAVVVDTGWRGKIPAELRRVMPPGFQWVTHFAHSDNPNIPSSRVFIESINKNVDSQSPTNHHQEIVDHVEHLPHFSDTATQLVQQGGKIEAIASSKSATRQKALALMGDIKAYASDAETKKRFRRLREDMGDLVKLARGDMRMKDQEVADLLRRLENLKGAYFLDDFKEALNKNLQERVQQDFWNQVSRAGQLSGSAAERTKFVDSGGQSKPPKGSDSAHSDSKGPYRKGETVTLPNNVTGVVERVRKDTKGLTHVFVSDQGREYEMITAPPSDANAKKELKSLVAKMDQLKQLGIPHISADLVKPNTVLRQFNAGEFGGDWLKGGGGAPGTWQLTALADLIEKLARAQVYLGNLRPDDVILDSRTNTWKIVDTSYVKVGESPSALVKKYVTRFGQRWDKGLAQDLDAELQNCKTVLKRAGL